LYLGYTSYTSYLVLSCLGFLVKALSSFNLSCSYIRLVLYYLGFFVSLFHCSVYLVQLLSKAFCSSSQCFVKAKFNKYNRYKSSKYLTYTLYL